MTVQTVPRPRLHLSQDDFYDRLSALEFGAIDDGQPSDRWVRVGEQVGLLHDEPGGRCVGFLVLELSTYDPDDEDHAELWTSPRFDVPALGLTDVSPNEIMLATRALFGSASTLNRDLFDEAISANGEEALYRWLRCLQSGDAMAHYGLGYTLYGLGRHQEAYRHLRHYSGLAPAEPWSWAWYGRAAAAIGETSEARTALARAIELDDEDEAGARADAQELLAELDHGTFTPPAPVRPRSVDAVLQHVVEQLVHEIGESITTANTDTDAIILVGIDQPVWVEVELDTGDALIRSQIGTIHESDFGEDAVDHLLAAISTLHTCELGPDNNDLYLHVDVPGLFVGHQMKTGLIRPLVLGAAACARDLVSYGSIFEIRILPARDAQAEYQLFLDSRS